MAEFQPIYPAHAIERCSITLAFKGEVPEKALKRIVQDTEPLVQKFGFIKGQQPIGFQIDAATGKLIRLVEGGPTHFVTTDNRQNLNLLPNAIVWVSKQYVRWENFKSQFNDVTQQIVQQFESLLSTSSIQLEYWDRFNWNGTWEDFDVTKLLEKSSPFVAAKSVSASKEWHSHIGWFEDLDGSRRLRNVNVDVVGLSDMQGLTRPSVGIYTMVRDQVSQDSDQPEFDKISRNDRLDTLHSELKNLLSDVICIDMSTRIGLDSKGP